MDLVYRVMFHLQQEYFAYLRVLARSGAAASPAPTFSDLINKVTSSVVGSLSPLPHAWYGNLHGNTRGRIGGGSQGGPGGTSPLREQSGMVKQVNAHADQGVLNRFRGYGHTSIKTILGDHEVVMPKHAGNDICLTWALKGECSNGCKRKAQHVRYGQAVTRQVHAMLDACGVANPQP